MSDELARAAENYLHDHHVDHISYGTGPGQLVCNQFVIACIRATLDPSFPQDVTADQFYENGHFAKVTEAKRGDLIHFPGHIGIVTNPDTGEFWGAQSKHGVGRAYYKGTSYWHGDFNGKKHDYFLRWQY